MQTVNTTEKGNRLEDQFHSYLLEQLESNKLVFGVYPAFLCKVFKKKRYFCKERQADVEFDVVIEVFGEGRISPHLHVVFECKNHSSPLKETHITDFSDKIRRVFGHGAKGLVVTKSRLQSGADNLARSRNLGIVKFDEYGIEISAERKGPSWAESGFLKKQIINESSGVKSLRFSAYSDGRFFGSISQMLQCFEQASAEGVHFLNEPHLSSVTFLPESEIRQVANRQLSRLKNTRRAVDIETLCALMELKLRFSDQIVFDSDGNQILGSANFINRSIEVNLHGNPHRERFTIAHELGHFCLGHSKYLITDSVVASDLLEEEKSNDKLNIERLEFQANIFASELILPIEGFLREVDLMRKELEIKDRGFGYIFVDDQRCNYTPYSQLLLSLSEIYNVSQQAIEIRLKRLDLVTDMRQFRGLKLMNSSNRTFAN